MITSQLIFLKSSLFKDLGLGRTGDEVVLTNYIRFFTDDFYIHVLWLTVQVSFLAMLFTLIFGFPVAYMIARLRSRWAMVLLAGIVISTFVTIVIKVFGIYIMFSSSGIINKVLMGSGLLEKPFTVIGNNAGVVV